MAYASKSLERSGTPKQNAIWGKLGDRFQAFAALWIGYELTFETTILQGPAFPGSVQQLTHCLRKRWPKLPPEPSKTQPGGTQTAPKSTPEAPMRAQMRPRAPKRRPKGAQETPKSGQNLPKSAPDAAKTGPGGPLTPPKTSLVRSKTRFGHDCHRQLGSKGSQSDFLRFFALCALLATCVPIQ